MPIDETGVGQWVDDNVWLVEAGFAVVAALLFFVVWRLAMRFLKRRARSSANEWDDMIVNAVGLPVTVLIVVLGAQQIGDAVILRFPYYPSVNEFFSLLGGLITIVAVFWVVLRLVSGAEALYRRRTLTVGDKEIDAGTMHSVFRVIRAIVFAIAALTAMNSAGVSISGILAFGGVGGVIIGFAAKDTLSNFFAGMLIFWERPFVIGDWIRRPDADVEGVVEHIGWRTTQIRTFDQRPLYVPNSLFFNSVIENPQRMTNRRIYEYMGLRYDDIDRLPAVLEDIRSMLQAHPDIDQGKILMVAFDRYGASSLDFFIYAMTKTTDWAEFHAVKERILLGAAAIVRDRGCEFAFPTRTLHVAGAASPPVLGGG